jgi:hypothetical protein
MRFDELDSTPTQHKIGYKYVRIQDDRTFQTPYTDNVLKIGETFDCKDEKGNIPTGQTNQYEKYYAGWHYYRGKNNLLSAIKSGDYDQYFRMHNFRDVIIKCEVREILHTGHAILKKYYQDGQDLKLLIGVSEFIKPIEIVYQKSYYKTTHTAAFLKKLTDNRGMKKIIEIYKKYRQKIIKLNGRPIPELSKSDISKISELLINTETSKEFASFLYIDSRQKLLKNDPFVKFMNKINKTLSIMSLEYIDKSKLKSDAAIAYFKLRKFRNHYATSIIAEGNPYIDMMFKTYD